MNDKTAWIWLGIMIFFIVIEALTPQLVSIWFAGGSLAALLLAIFKVEFVWQLVAFVAVSILLLLVTRPLVKKLTRNKSADATNTDRNLGREAVVTEKINNIEGTGLISISGVIWSARAGEQEILDKGERVVVDKIEGVRAIVRKI